MVCSVTVHGEGGLDMNLLDNTLEGVLLCVAGWIREVADNVW